MNTFCINAIQCSVGLLDFTCCVVMTSCWTTHVTFSLFPVHYFSHPSNLVCHIWECLIFWPRSSDDLQWSGASEKGAHFSLSRKSVPVPTQISHGASSQLEFLFVLAPFFVVVNKPLHARDVKRQITAQQTIREYKKKDKNKREYLQASEFQMGESGDAPKVRGRTARKERMWERASKREKWWQVIFHLSSPDGWCYFPSSSDTQQIQS